MAKFYQSSWGAVLEQARRELIIDAKVMTNPRHAEWVSKKLYEFEEIVLKSAQDANSDVWRRIAILEWRRTNPGEEWRPAELSRSLEELEIGVRTATVLREMGCKTLSDVARLKRAELLRVPNCGRKNIEEIERALGRAYSTLAA